MNITDFLFLLSAFSLITSLVVEGVKKTFPKFNNYNLLALVVSIIIGSLGSIIYFYLSDIVINLKMIIYAMLLGLSSGLVSMVGFDKVKQTIVQMIGGNSDGKVS